MPKEQMPEAFYVIGRQRNWEYLKVSWPELLSNVVYEELGGVPQLNYSVNESYSFDDLSQSFSELKALPSLLS